MENNSSNPSLFKNVIALYVRMIFSVCVNLYISRVVLDVLGVEDFGIYNIVGAIVVMLGFINSSMSGSTSRFLSIAIGENRDDILSQTYNTAKHLHCLIAKHPFREDVCRQCTLSIFVANYNCFYYSGTL